MKFIGYWPQSTTRFEQTKVRPAAQIKDSWVFT
ncbi:hypothetical protein SNOG_03760 [Parastagonospora nodorum SN15]|uniref:Uncharacterized protein n=1 Tax=Phaeosphaeria nodorum (strain SN15 / ATCC MYA-4574 / FGSC 10173) TaxID=321614 RepID=Q0UWV4_PHANO|nr:hypothetical protein SNOG_03760 [Parastagonospora nodorum SN15]EAT88965.1 hypothetical protein SNOG_03760 [Parastagonospora nodorum SN15]